MNEENITLSGISSGDISGSAGQEDSLSGSITEESISGNLSDDSLSGDIKSESEMNGNLNIGGSVSKEEVYEIIEEYLEENPVDVVSDYPDLTNKPKINDVELEGNKTLQELGIQPEGDYASIDDIPTKNSQLENDSGYLTEHQSLDGYATESWVEDKGYLTEHQDLSSYALKTEIPINVSELENDSGYLTEHQDLSSYALKTEIPQVPSWAMQSAKPKYTATEVGADPAGSAENAFGQANSALSTHNTNTDAHNDIRLFLIDIANRLNALANSDDETLDQMNEVVAYIKDNRELIEQITTNKVNVADIIDNLTTNVSNKPLSAAQGVALKTLFDNLPSWSKEATKPSYTYSEVGAEQSGTADVRVSEHNASGTAHEDIRNAVAAIKVPTKVSELENDKKYLTEHQSLDEYSKTTDMLKLVYPVGAVYISTTSTSPATLFGFGTWARIQDRFLLSAGSTYSAGATGGEAEHTLTVNEMPKHSHTAKGWAAVIDGSGSYITLGAEGASATYSTRETGDGQAHNNMPPYFTVYMWQRTA